MLVQRLQAIENSRAMQSKRKATDPEEHKVSDKGQRREYDGDLLIYEGHVCRSISISDQ